MLIYTIWHEPDEDDMDPWLVDAIDECCVEHGDGHQKVQEWLGKPRHRLLIVRIPNAALAKLFKPPTVEGAIVEDDAPSPSPDVARLVK